MRGVKLNLHNLWLTQLKMVCVLGCERLSPSLCVCVPCCIILGIFVYCGVKFELWIGIHSHSHTLTPSRVVIFSVLGLHSEVISNLFAYFEAQQQQKHGTWWTSRGSCLWGRGRWRGVNRATGIRVSCVSVCVSFVSTWPGTKVSQVSFSEDINFEPGGLSEECVCVWV